MEKVFFDLTKKDHEKESHRNYVQLILNDDIIYKTDFIRFNYLYFRFVLAWKFNRLGKTNF